MGARPGAGAAFGLLPPARNGHVLITSRATAWPELYAVRPLDPSAAVELLIGQSGDDDRIAAEALAAELGGLPLALTQAAGFVRANAVNLATYLRWYRDRSAELHNEGRPADYPHTVATTWQLAIDRLSADARMMLNVFAFCAPDAIPVHLLFGSMDELARHRAIGALRAHSVVMAAGQDRVTVHRLVQAATRDQLGPQRHEWLDNAHARITAAMPAPPATAISLVAWNALHTHAFALLNHLPPEHPQALTLRHDLAHWTGEVGDMPRARDLLAELLSARERVLGVEHPDTLTTRHDLAHWVGAAGNAPRARDLYAELIPIRERVLGAEHPDTLRTKHRLAHWIGEAGDAARARDLFAELLPVRERVLGAEHLDTLKTRSRHARWIGEAGDAARARDLYAELLSVRQRVLGAEHRSTLRTRFHLARWTGNAGNAVRAKELLATLLPIHQRVLGVEHVETLATRRELARWARLAGAAEEEGPGGGGEG